MFVILSARPSLFPITLQKMVIVVGIVFTLGIMELVLVRLSSPENMIFFKACTKPEESGQLKPDQIFSQGYSLRDWTFVAVQSSSYIFHIIGLATTLATAFWLRKQEKIIASDSVHVSSNFKSSYARHSGDFKVSILFIFRAYKESTIQNVS